MVVRHCLCIRSLVLLSFGMGIFTIFGYAAAIWMPSYFMLSHGMSMIEAGAWLGVGAAIGGVVGSLAGGAIVDALVPRDKRWQLRVPAAGLLLSFPLLAAMFLLPGGAEMRIAGHSVPLIAPISLLSSFLTSLWAGPSYAAVARLVPTAMRAQAIGLLVIVLNATGSLLGPLIAGLVSDILTPRFGTEALRYSLLMMSTLVVVGGLVIWRASHYYRSEILD
jgi:MFS family permease